MRIKRILSIVMCFVIFSTCTTIATSKTDPIETYKKQITQLKSQISTMVKANNENLKKSNTLQMQIVALINTTNELKASIAIQTSTTKDLQGQLTTQNSTIKELQTLVSAQTSIMKDLQEQLTRQNTTIKELLAKQNTIQNNTATGTSIPASYPQIPTNNQDMTVKIAGDSSKGFNYSYFLYIPAGISKTVATRLLVEPNNTGHPTTDTIEIEKNAQEMAEIYNSHSIAQKLSIPLLIPAFPRTYDTYTHDLGRSTIQIKEGSLKRIDMQLVAMIKDAQKYLAKYNITVQDKVFLNGFSASSHFSNRFALMYPEMVRAVATGGINSLPIIPSSSVSGTNLRYPIGISDLKELTGISFNMDEYKKVSQFIFMGANDANDTAKASDCFEDQDTTVIFNLLGQKMVPDRFTKVQQIFNDLGLTSAVQFHVYAGIGHEEPSYVWNDLTEFFRNNMSDVSNGFTPHP